jgi:hypothetical protein
MLFASLMVPSSGSVIDASVINCADIVSSVIVSAASAWVARGEVLINETGFPGNSWLPTSQSSAFFITPEMPRAYSGLEIRRPPAVPMTVRNFAISAGEEGELAYSLKELDLDAGRRQAAGCLKHRGVVRGGAQTAGNRNDLH